MVDNQQQQQQVEKVINSFRIDDNSLRTITSLITQELDLGLRDEEAATIKMLITYVRELARGDETGVYLALDLGGSHFRVLLVELNGEAAEPKVTTAVHDIPDEILTTQNGQELFDYIAIKLLEFVKEHRLRRRRISLGFTFSFPCKQYGLTQSVLVKWCKGFNVGGVVGTDVVRQLKDALKRQLAGLSEAYVDVVAVINDTTGTLVACANKHRDCRIGLIVGTGFNSCYMERLDKCEKWPANYTNPKQVIINCEWGAMGDNKEKRELDKFRNEFDAIVDVNSVNPRNQTYEKMVSGMYVGELLRLAMLKLYNSNSLFVAEKQQQQQQATVPRSRPPSMTAPMSSSCKSMKSEHTQDKQSTTATKSLSSPKIQSSVGASSPGKTNLKSKSSLDAPSGSQMSSSSPIVSPQNTDNAAVDSNKSSACNNKLNVRNVLNGKHLSMLALDEINQSHEHAIKIMKVLNVKKFSKSDLNIVVKLASAIMHRSANLVAAGIVALLERMQRPNTVIGYDGSMIKLHPYFLKRLIEKTNQLNSKEYKFEFIESSDGSGIGAAVVAAALHKERRPLYVVKQGKLYELHFPKSTNSSFKLN